MCNPCHCNKYRLYVSCENCLLDSTDRVHATRDGGVCRGRPPPRLSGPGHGSRQRHGIRLCRHRRVSSSDQEGTVLFEDDEVHQEEA